MLEENKNIKDSQKNSLKDTSSSMLPAYETESFHTESLSISFSKTNNLITALYMVTDIMDKEEPLRNKLRTLGVNIISDMELPQLTKGRDGARFVNEVLSLLDIASAIGMISEMNSNILKKEFLELKQYIQKHNQTQLPDMRVSLSNFFAESPLLDEEGGGGGDSREEKNKSNSIGHDTKSQNRIGVQSGSTLMKALKGLEGIKTRSLSNSMFHGGEGFHSGFDALKKERRDEIIKVIKNHLNSNNGIVGATITDIRNDAKGALVSCGEKTLQRELVSMVHDGVLYKTGEKRWSRYSLKK